MVRHLITAAIAAFWISMNALLWYNEFGPGRQPDSQIPLDAVLQRVLNATDPSTLRLTRHGRDLGQLRWVPTLLEAPQDPNRSQPEGMVARIEGYRIDIDFIIVGSTPDTRWRVLAEIQLGPDRTWRELQVRLIQRPVTWEIVTRAGEDSVLITYEEGRDTRIERRIGVRDLEQARDVLGPMAQLLPPGLWSPTPDPSATTGILSPWIARNSQFSLGKHRIRAYSVSTRLFNQFEIIAHFSRAGELLKVVLPDQYLLDSSALPIPATR